MLAAFLHRLAKDLPELAASLGLTGVGLLSMLQVIQAGLGIVLTVLGIVSTVIIIRKNLGPSKKKTPPYPTSGDGDAR